MRCPGVAAEPQMECGDQERASTATTSIISEVRYGDRNPLCVKIAVMVPVWASATRGSQGWVAKGARSDFLFEWFSIFVDQTIAD